MKYIFGFNVGCKIYKKFPKIYISLNNKLIDEIELDNDHLYNEINLLDRKTYPDTESGRKNFIADRLFSKKINLYTLDNKDLHGKITLKIRNDDNNYTNGFMTRSTQIKFSFVFLIPEFILFERRKELLEKLKYSRKIEINDVNDVSKKKLIRWPADNNHSDHWYGDSRALDFPIFDHGIRYKRFNNNIFSPGEYWSSKELDLDTNTDDDVYIAVRRRLLMILDKVL